MDELLGEFLTETNENIASLDNDIVLLEQTPDNIDLLSHIFRSIHTIKGTCGFIGLPRLEKVAHAGENIFGKIRDKELAISPEIISLVLECLDRIKFILAELETHEKEPDGDDSGLIAKLTLASLGQLPVEFQPCAEEAATFQAPALDIPALEAIFSPYAEDVSSLNPNVNQQKSEKKNFERTELTESSQNQEDLFSGGDSLSTKSIRVNVSVLENLMNMVSEMVLTRNQLMQMVRKTQDSEFEAPLQRLNHITSELQDAVMKTRMQPIGNAWAKLPRLVRDLSRDLGKKIDLKLMGEETELDRQVLELVRDPLTHMVRN